MSTEKGLIPDWLIDASPNIISHMNEDHSGSIVSTLNAQHQIKDTNAKMTSLETHGYHVMSRGKLYFLTFEKPCKTSEDYKIELVKHAKRYRDFELAE